MAKEVTATKKRPPDFKSLVGQEFVVSTLENSIKHNAIANAYLFSGPRGVGKTSAARILAKALNCAQGPTIQPCGVCDSCKEIARGNSLDVIEIDGASNTSVNDIRAIKDEVMFAPNSSRYKVYIIDEVHMLSNSAFNALLKTVEEPPEHVVFIFATTEVQKVPATIRSRCQQFHFRLLSYEAITGLLEQLSVENGFVSEKDALFWIAKESTGSLRDAYTLYDQVASFSDKHITLEKIRSKLGLVGIDRLTVLFDHITGGQLNKAMEFLAELFLAGVSIDQLVFDIAEYLRGLLLVKSGVERDSILGCSKSQFVKWHIDAFTIGQLERGLELTFALHRNLKHSMNPRFEMELVVSKLCKLSYFVPVEQIVKSMSELKQLVAGNPVQTAVKKDDKSPGQEQEPDAEPEDEPGQYDDAGMEDLPPQSGDPAPLTEEDIRDELLKALRKEKLTLAGLIEKSGAWKKDGSTVLVLCENRFSFATLKQDIQILNRCFSTVYRENIVVRLQLVDASETAAEETGRSEEVDMVEQVRRVFRGEIVE